MATASELGVRELVQAIRSGDLTSTSLTRALATN
jgi:hypothetical protein